MQRKSDEIIGAFIREEKDGDEHIHYCLSCGRDKLSVNQGLSIPHKAGVYHCWGCGISGRDLKGVTFPVFTVSREQTITNTADEYNEMLRQAVADTRPQDLAVLLTKRDISTGVVEPFSLSFEPNRKEHDRVALPMYLGGRPCGYQTWRPSERVKYKNEGARGVAGESILPKATHVVICEGMFDAFRIWEVLDEEWTAKARFVLCTCGSDVSSSQVSEILGRVPECACIYIAFDNDKLSRAVKSYNLLRPYRDVHVALPPNVLGGDWDDIFKEDTEWARKYWLMTLKRK